MNKLTMTRMNRFLRGFTLIEVMVVVAIIGILATIAWPSFQEAIARSRRADAKVVLLENAQFMERYFTQNNTYLDVTGNPALALPITEAPKDGGTKYYDLGFSVARTATTYTLQAAPKNAMAADPCGTLTLTQAGVKGVASASRAADLCWSK